MVCLVLDAHFGHLLANKKTFLLHSSWNAVIQDQAVLIPFTDPHDCPGSSIRVGSDNPPTGATKVQEPITGDKSSVSDSFLPPILTKRFYLAFLILTLLQIAQTTFKCFGCLAQRSNSLQEHTRTVWGFKRRKWHIRSVSAHGNMAQEGK